MVIPPFSVTVKLVHPEKNSQNGMKALQQHGIIQHEKNVVIMMLVILFLLNCAHQGISKLL